jgi:hypothetical protein
MNPSCRLAPKDRCWAVLYWMLNMDFPEHHTCELRRTPLLGTSVDKGTKKDRRQSATKLTSFGSDEAPAYTTGAKKCWGRG